MNKHRLLGTAAVVFALSAPPVAGAAPTSYSDPSGDNGAAADVSAVTLEAAADGYIHINTTLANVQMPSAGPASVVVAFDTDRSGSTGSLAGADYIVGFDFQDLKYFFGKWDGSTYADVGNQEQSDLLVIANSTGVEFRVRPAGLGGSEAFNFVVMAGTGSADGGVDFDFAPDNGSWAFEVTKAAKVLTVERVNATFVPAVPRAGRVFQAPVVRVTLSDGTTILAPSFRCVAELGGKLLRGAGRGGCTFKVPKTAKGKRLLVTLFVTYKGVTDEFKPYVFKVR